MDGFSLFGLLGLGAMSSAFTAAGNSRQRKWAAAQAAAQRQWQEEMASTAHQREVADLRKAGLNPILSATGGSGAAVPSGAVLGASSNDEGSGFRNIDIVSALTSARRLQNETRLTNADIKLKEAEADAASARAAKDRGQFTHEVNLLHDKLLHEAEQAGFNRQLQRTLARIGVEAQQNLQRGEHLQQKDLQWMKSRIDKSMVDRQLDHTFQTMDKQHMFDNLMQTSRLKHEDLLLVKKLMHERLLQDRQFAHEFEKMSNAQRHELVMQIIKSVSPSINFNK